ncbi:hypothetical protein DER45DRAFT_580265 [Fusarium avenaceum]|nr:hypothetical protein DER45DRAFT_580265 [Fusarium avenaceum]
MRRSYPAALSLRTLPVSYLLCSFTIEMHLLTHSDMQSSSIIGLVQEAGVGFGRPENHNSGPGTCHIRDMAQVHREYACLENEACFSAVHFANKVRIHYYSC